MTMAKTAFKMPAVVRPRADITFFPPVASYRIPSHKVLAVHEWRQFDCRQRVRIQMIIPGFRDYAVQFEDHGDASAFERWLELKGLPIEMLVESL